MCTVDLSMCVLLSVWLCSNSTNSRNYEALFDSHMTAVRLCEAANGFDASSSLIRRLHKDEEESFEPGRSLLVSDFAFQQYGGDIEGSR